MGKFSGYLLCSDFDGTFASEDKTFHKKNIEMSNYFMDNGGQFTLATGRSIISTIPFLPHFKISAPAILFNGAVIYDFEKDKTIDATYIGPIWKEYVKDIFKKFPELTVKASVEKKDFIFGKTDNFGFLLFQEDDYEISSSIDNMPDNVVNILFVGQPDTIVNVDKYVGTAGFNKARFARSAPVLLELIPFEISKGRAVEILSDHLGIKKENTFSIGDYYNDIELLQYAGFSAAVANAPDDIKKVADIIVDSNNDGAVGHFIEIINEKIK